MGINENIKLKGKLKIYVRDINKGEWEVVDEVENVITRVGKEHMAKRSFDAGYSGAFVYFAWSDDGTTAVSEDNTILAEEDGRKGITKYEWNATAKKITITCDLGTEDGNTPGTLRRFGLFTASTGGVMFNELIHTAITKTNTKEVKYTYELTLT